MLPLAPYFTSCLERDFNSFVGFETPSNTTKASVHHDNFHRQKWVLSCVSAPHSVCPNRSFTLWRMDLAKANGVPTQYILRYSCFLTVYFRCFCQIQVNTPRDNMPPKEPHPKRRKNVKSQEESKEALLATARMKEKKKFRQLLMKAQTDESFWSSSKAQERCLMHAHATCISITSNVREYPKHRLPHQDKKHWKLLNYIF